MFIGKREKSLKELPTSFIIFIIHVFFRWYIFPLTNLRSRKELMLFLVLEKWKTLDLLCLMTSPKSQNKEIICNHKQELAK